MTLQNIYFLQKERLGSYIDNLKDQNLIVNIYNAATMQTYNIDLRQIYLGFELGGGKIIRFNDDHSLDIYGKYFYLHQGSDSFDAGGHYKVHAIDSHRLRLAGRYQYNYTPRTVLYTGLGGEYEFDGYDAFLMFSDLGGWFWANMTHEGSVHKEGFDATDPNAYGYGVDADITGDGEYTVSITKDSILGLSEPVVVRKGETAKVSSETVTA